MENNDEMLDLLAHINEFLEEINKCDARKKQLLEEQKRIKEEMDAITKEIREACKGKNRDRKRAEVRKHMFKVGHSRPLRI